MKWTPYGFFFEKNELGHIRPNQRYYRAEIEVFYGKKIRQHGKPKIKRLRGSQCRILRKPKTI